MHVARAGGSRAHIHAESCTMKCFQTTAGDPFPGRIIYIYIYFFFLKWSDVCLTISVVGQAFAEKGLT